MGRMFRGLLAGMLAMGTAMSHAQVVRSGDWTLNLDLDGVQIASTKNEAGAVTGIVCLIASESCVAYIVTSSACTPGAKYPMMINSAVSAAAVTTECAKLQGINPSRGDTYNVFSEFGVVRSAYESGGEIGFAIPLESGAFRVLRFSTKGATQAIRGAMTLPEKRKPAKSRPDTLL